MAHQLLVSSIVDFLNTSIANGSVPPDKRDALKKAANYVAKIFDVDPANDRRQVLPATLQTIFNHYLDPDPSFGLGISFTNQIAAESHKATGNDQFTAKDYASAIESYTRAIKLDPSNPVYYSNRAAAHSFLGNHAKARKDAEKAIKLDPGFIKAYSRLGHSLISLGEIASAAAVFQRGLQLNPHVATLKSGLEQALSRIQALGGDSQSPIPLADPTILAEWLVARFRQSGSKIHIDGAISVLDQWLALVPKEHQDRAQFLTNVACYLEIRFDHFGSVADFERAILSCESVVEDLPVWEPNRPNTLRNLSVLRFKRYQLFQSLADYNRGIWAAEESIKLMPRTDPDRLILLLDVGTRLQVRYEMLGDVADHERAISILEQVVKELPQERPERSNALSSLAGALRTRFDRFGVTADLDQSISLYESVLSLIPNGHPERAMHICNLGVALRTRFEVQGGISTINRAVELLEEGVSLTPDAHPQLHKRWSNLAITLQAKFAENSDVVDLDRALSFIARAVAITPKGHPSRPVYLSNQGLLLGLKFDKFDVIDDLNRAISSSEEACRDTPPGHPQRSIFLSTLGTLLLKKFTKFGVSADLDRAISLAEESVSLTPDNHHQRQLRLEILGMLYGLKFQRTTSSDDLNKTIDAYEKALTCSPKDHANRLELLTNLIGFLVKRFERSEFMADLDRGIMLSDQVVALTPEGHDDRFDAMSQLGGFLLKRFEWTKAVADINRAISINEHVLAHSPTDHPSHPMVLSNLGCVLRFRFELVGDMKDLDRAISINEQAVDLNTHSGPHQRATILSNLASSFYFRFSRLGALTDLDQAIGRNVEATECMPDDFANRHLCHAQLGSFLLHRFEWLGVVADLGRAISSLEHALELSPEGNPDRPAVLSYLGTAFHMRFMHGGTVDDIERAAAAGEEALSLTSDENPDRPIWTLNLTSTLLAKFLQFEEGSAIDRAITLSEHALSLLPENLPIRPMYLLQLAVMLMIRAGIIGQRNQLSLLKRLLQSLLTRDFDLLADFLADQSDILPVNDGTDLDRAISTIETAISLSPEGHPQWSRGLYLTGLAFWARFQQTRSDDDLNRAVSSLKTMIDAPIGRIVVKFRAALSMVEFGRSAKRMNLALDGYKAAIRLLPLLAWRGLDSETRLANLKEWSQGLACDAAACAIDQGEFETAVELLEQSRSIFWAQTSELRTDLQELESTAPELAKEFLEVSQALEGGSFQHSSLLGVVGLDDKPNRGQALETVVQRYHRLAERWDVMIRSIRQITGLENFLLPTPFQQLRRVANHGPVVILNVSKFRCDAIILTTKLDRGVDVLALSLTSQDATQLATRLRDNLRLFSAGKIHARELDGQTFHPMLAELWKLVAGPVLKRVQELCSSSGARPRIWWCPTGPLTFLPIHAAGLYDGRKELVVPDNVTSSYTTTLSALLRAREKPPSQSLRMTIVGVGSGDHEQRPIPKVLNELSEIQSLTSTLPFEQPPALVGSDATIERVTTALTNSNWAHIACHGHQDAENPMNSYLRLHDGPLSISRIATHRLPHFDFVFLSACHTATGLTGFEDEAFHISAAFQFSGCSGVIGTMWAIHDRHGPVVSEKVYGHLFRRNRVMECPNSAEAARALNRAVRHLRSNGTSPHEWVPFIHIGV